MLFVSLPYNLRAILDKGHISGVDRNFTMSMSTMTMSCIYFRAYFRFSFKWNLSSSFSNFTLLNIILSLDCWWPGMNSGMVWRPSHYRFSPPSPMPSKLLKTHHDLDYKQYHNWFVFFLLNPNILLSSPFYSFCALTHVCVCMCRHACVYGVRGILCSIHYFWGFVCIFCMLDMIM